MKTSLVGQKKPQWKIFYGVQKLQKSNKMMNGNLSKDMGGSPCQQRKTEAIPFKPFKW